MRIKSKLYYQKKKTIPQCVNSITVPDQAPTLKYILGQLMSGNAVNVQNMRYDNEPSHDDPDLRSLDLRNTASSDIDRVLQMYYPQNSDIVSTEPSSEQQQ